MAGRAGEEGGPTWGMRIDAHLAVEWGRGGRRVGGKCADECKDAQDALAALLLLTHLKPMPSHSGTH